MATYAVGGVEKIRVAPAVTTEAAITTGLATALVLEYVADAVAYTRNVDTLTDLVPEDKEVAFVTFATPGEADQITVGLLQQDPAVMAMFENVVYTPATTKIVNLAKRKIANVMLEITTRSMKDGRKQIVVLPNVAVTLSYVNNLNKTSLQQLLLTGRVGSFKTTTGNLDAISIKTWVTEAGAPIDSTNP